MRVRSLLASLVACLAVLTSSERAPAQQIQQVKGWALDRFDPSERGSDWFVQDSLDLRGTVRPAFGVGFDWASRPLSVFNPNGSERAAIVNNQIFLHPGASLVLFDRVRAAFDLPIAIYQDGENAALKNFRFTAPTDAALGDLRLSLDLRLFGRYGGVVTGAIGTEVFIPTGSIVQYAGDGDPRIVPRFQLAGDVSLFTYAARGGLLIRTNDPTIVGQQRGDSVVFGASAGVRVLDKKLVVGPEIYGSASLTNGDVAQLPIEALLGAHYTIANAFRVGAGAGTGLTKAYGEPPIRLMAMLEFVPPYKEAIKEAVVTDNDGDGILNDDDACPDEAGPKTSNPDTTGCPPPKDTDKDGIIDSADACPELAGPKNDDPKINGCPPDTDGDGVRDPIDACPNVAGVEQADPTQNGCPPDSDRDGIIDEEDACPDVAGIKSTDPQYNGCPDPDRDHDGVKNDVDACPDEAGAPARDPAKNGCPKAFVKAGQIRILDQVKFKTASAQILPGKDSEEVLSAVAKVMVDHPEITHVTVEGHTDNKGDPKGNKRLSEQRAAAVVKWLVLHGVDASKLTSEGFGQERPLESNSTDDGRKTNRRVEFHIEAAKKE